MPKRRTQEEFLTLAKSLRPEWDFSHFEYRGEAAESTVICHKHGPFKMSGKRVLRGDGCKHCWEDRRGKAKRTPFQQFLDKCAEIHRGRYDYSSIGAWQGSSAKITIICPEHGPFQQIASLHMNGQGCQKCGYVRVAGASRRSQGNFIKALKAVHGDKYNLDKVNYINSSTPVTLTCETHGDFSARPSNLLYRKSGCPSCAKEENGKRSRLNFDDVVSRAINIHGDKYRYTQGVYTPGQPPQIEVVCKVHGVFRQYLQDHLAGRGCRKCTSRYHDTSSYVETVKAIHKDRYDYSLVQYKKAHGFISIVCKEHGVFSQRAYSHAEGQGCPRCAGVGPSKGQLEVAAFLQAHIPVISEFSMEWSKKRIDIFIPSKNIGIEYHGLIWHSEKFQKDNLAMADKQIEAEVNGIRIINIFEDEWKNKPEVVKQTLLTALGLLPRIAYARQCSISNVSAEVANSFIESNHLQGGVRGCIHYGAFYSGVLVAIMSFSRITSHRGVVKNIQEYELRRFCTSGRVPGIASKIFSAFRKDMTPDMVISYSDKRAFSGGMYKQLGFLSKGSSIPSYYYVSPTSRRRLHKGQFKHSELRKKFPNNYDPNKTEWENCNANGWYRLFDCGTVKWVWTKENPT